MTSLWIILIIREGRGDASEHKRRGIVGSELDGWRAREKGCLRRAWGDEDFGPETGSDNHSWSVISSPPVEQLLIICRAEKKLSPCSLGWSWRWIIVWSSERTEPEERMITGSSGLVLEGVGLSDCSIYATLNEKRKTFLREVDPNKASEPNLNTIQKRLLPEWH